MASSDPYQPVFENADLNLSSLLNSSLLKLGENENFNCSFNNSLLLTPDVSSQPSPGRLNTSTPTPPLSSPVFLRNHLPELSNFASFPVSSSTFTTTTTSSVASSSYSTTVISSFSISTPSTTTSIASSTSASTMIECEIFDGSGKPSVRTCQKESCHAVKSNNKRI